MDDIFEIFDFTSATEWERFISELERIIHDLLLHYGSSEQRIPIDNVQMSGSRPVSFCGLCFDIKHFGRSHSCLPSDINKQNDVFDDLGDSKQDFMKSESQCGHLLADLYCLKEFFTLDPVDDDQDSVETESLQNIILSAIYIATLNTNTTIPFFVRYGKLSRGLYVGACQNQDLRTCFEMVRLKNMPVPRCAYLSGLIDMFKEKMASPLLMRPPVKVSLQFTYNLLCTTSISNNFSNVDALSCSKFPITKHDFFFLPFGTTANPLKEIVLYASWHDMREDTIVENVKFSDVDPMSAAQWSLSMSSLSELSCLMTSFVQEYLELTACHRTLNDLLGDSDTSSKLVEPLDRLTSSPLSSSAFSRRVVSATVLAADKLSTFNDRIIEENPSDTPTSSNQLDQMIDFAMSYLFDPAKPSSETLSINLDTLKTDSNGELLNKYDTSATTSNGQTLGDDITSVLMSCYRKAKVAHQTSFCSKLALILCHLVNVGGVTALCAIWRKILAEFRTRFDNSMPIPCLSGDRPSLDTCLLNQKLQMLNCCINKKVLRENGVDSRPTNQANDLNEDVFYDCVETSDDLNSVALKAEGRLRPLNGTICLIKRQEELLYVPVTQDPAPFTEDMLDEHTHALLELGSSDNSADLRTKLQCPSLVSDMEAFKAANPGCIFEDFLRWYSPKDLVVNEKDCDPTYELSERMTVPGNAWTESWKNARPRPVSKQMRLFNDTKEAEKILHWLDSLKISEVVRLTLSPLFFISLINLCHECEPIKSIVCNDLKALLESFPKITRSSNFVEYDDFRKSMSKLEALVAIYQTLHSHLTTQAKELGVENLSSLDLDTFVGLLTKGERVKIVGGSKSDLGRVITNLLAKDSRVLQENESSEPLTKCRAFPPAKRKEYVLRCYLPRPVVSSRYSFQRLYVSVGDEFLAAGAFTEDVEFFTPTF